MIGLGPSLAVENASQTAIIARPVATQTFERFNATATDLNADLTAAVAYGHQMQKFYLALQFAHNFFPIFAKSTVLSALGITPGDNFTASLTGQLK